MFCERHGDRFLQVAFGRSKFERCPNAAFGINSKKGGVDYLKD